MNRGQGLGGDGDGRTGVPSVRAQEMGAQKISGKAPRVRPLPGMPVLVVEGKPRTLVASDVHVGLSRAEGQSGVEMVGGPTFLAERLIGAARRTRSGRVLLLGDLKEPILGAPPQTRRELRLFFDTLLGAGLRVEVCPGNHDIGLSRWLPSSVVLTPSRGLLRDGVGYFHGHAWPSPEILEGAATLVAGHLHPGYRLASGKVPCWVRVKPGGPRPFRATEVIILPAFNPLCSSEALNQERPRRSRTFLVHRFLSTGEARAYLLDGTDLGRLHLKDGPRED